MSNLLGALVDQARQLATRMGGNPDRESVCHFCGAGVPLWEYLLVMQLSGVPAHVQCPPEFLDAKLKEAGPDEAFPYADFSRTIDEKMLVLGKEGTTLRHAISGEISR